MSPIELAEALRQSYLGFACSNCRTPIRVFAIPVARPTPRLDVAGTRPLWCPNCNHHGTYHSSDLTRFEEAQLVEF